MHRVAVTVCCLLACVGLVFCEVGHQTGQQRPPVVVQPGAGHKRAQQFHDKTHTEDKQHIMEHLDGHVDGDKLSDREMNFHYFKIHDYDQNSRLDGIELIAALTDYHRESGSEDVHRMSDSEMADMVDLILKSDDKDNDGYIDYGEFIKSQQNEMEEDSDPQIDEEEDTET